MPHSVTSITYSMPGNSWENTGEGMMKEAMAGYNQAVRNDPGGAWVYNQRGNAYRRSGHYQRAIQDYNEAIRRAPKFAESYAGRAFAYTLLSKDEKAQEDIARAAELGFEATLLEREVEELKKRRQLHGQKE
jgi:tetratricopeptide (TPR) repeat protein